MSNQETMTREELKQHLRALDAPQGDKEGDKSSPDLPASKATSGSTDVGPLNQANKHDIADLKDGTHSIPELAAHRDRIEKAHNDEKAQPTSLGLSQDYVKQFLARGTEGHPNGVAADKGR